MVDGDASGVSESEVVEVEVSESVVVEVEVSGSEVVLSESGSLVVEEGTKAGALALKLKLGMGGRLEGVGIGVPGASADHFFRSCAKATSSSKLFVGGTSMQIFPVSPSSY